MLYVPARIENLLMASSLKEILDQRQHGKFYQPLYGLYKITDCQSEKSTALVLAAVLWLRYRAFDRTRDRFIEV